MPAHRTTFTNKVYTLHQYNMARWQQNLEPDGEEKL